MYPTKESVASSAVRCQQVVFLRVLQSARLFYLLVISTPATRACSR